MIFCKDLNDLMNVVESNVGRRQAELPRAEVIIADELAKFSAWCNLLPVTPVVAELKRWGEEMARAELAKNRHRFDQEDFENVEKLVTSVVKKIIGIPMAHLLDSQADVERALLKAEYVRLLFNLNGSSETAEKEGAVEEIPQEEPRNGAPTNGHGNGAAKADHQENRGTIKAGPNA
jgi:glutamyl-tRNA reductase